MEQVARSAKQLISHLTLRRLLALTVLYWVPVVIIAKLFHDMAERDSITLDTRFLDWLHTFSNPALDWIMPRLTNLASPVVIIVVGLAFSLILLRRRHYRDLVVFVFGLGGAIIINTALKFYFHRSRPDLWRHLVSENGYSFPSGHAMMSMALMMCLTVILWPTRWRIPTLILGTLYVLVVGISRMYLGVHFPTDIIGGWCVSLVWVLLVVAVIEEKFWGWGKTA